MLDVETAAAGSGVSAQASPEEGGQEARSLRIALIGTRGVPARYGGFETCVEEVGQRLVRLGHRVQVYCRLAPGERREDQPERYLGMELIHLPAVQRRSLETLSHSALSVAHRSLSGVDCAVLFNAANAPFLPMLRARGIPTATHVDGLEWRRSKWGGAGRRYYRAVEALAVRWSRALIADAEGIAAYYRVEFGAETELIAYGAPIIEEPQSDRLAEVGLAAGAYHLVVARFERENHVLEAVLGYVATDAELPLVVVGSAPYAGVYTEQVSRAADERVRLLGGIWDQDQLDQLYANALTYIHGHSVGGTNPSLLRAAGAGAYTVAYDCAFNREVLEDNGDYWSTPEDLGSLLLASERSPEDAAARGRSTRDAIRRYDWDDVARSYESLCRALVRRPARLRSSSGRRQGRWIDDGSGRSCPGTVRPQP